jgi:copper(I)-binding protein
MSYRTACRLALVTCLVPVIVSPSLASQRVVRALEGWVQPGDGNTATAYVLVENGTMYDVFIAGAETPQAGAVTIMQRTEGKAAPVREVSIPAFDRLAMSPEGVFLQITGLKRPLETGEGITIHLRTDGGEVLTVTATTK